MCLPKGHPNYYRCGCKEDRTVFDKRINNRRYREDLAVKFASNPELAAKVKKLPFTALPDLVKDSGMDPATVSAAMMPDSTKRHPLSDEDRAVVKEAVEYRKALDGDRNNMMSDQTANLRAAKSDNVHAQAKGRDEIESALTSAAGDVARLSKTKNTAALNKAKARMGAAQYFADELNRRSAPGRGSVSMKNMIDDPKYLLDHPHALRDMSNTELSEAWNAAEAHSDELTRNRALTLLGQEGAARGLDDPEAASQMNVGADGVVYSRLSNKRLEQYRKMCDGKGWTEGTDLTRAERKAEKAKIESEIARRSGRAELTDKQREAISNTRGTAHMRERAKAADKATKMLNGLSDKYKPLDRNVAMRDVLFTWEENDLHRNPVDYSSKGKITVLDAAKEQSFWEASVKAGKPDRDAYDPADIPSEGVPVVMAATQQGTGKDTSKKPKVRALPKEATTPSFLSREYKMIVSEGYTSMSDYLNAYREDHSVKLNRNQRMAVWEVVCQFNKRCGKQRKVTPEAGMKIAEKVKEGHALNT